MVWVGLLLCRFVDWRLWMWVLGCCCSGCVEVGYLVVAVLVRCCFGVGVLLGLGWLRLALLLCMIFGGLFDLVELG